MTNEQIKKELYKRKPDAQFISAKRGHLMYQTDIDGQNVFFLIPFADIGDAEFSVIMPAHLLIRYIV